MFFTHDFFLPWAIELVSSEDEVKGMRRAYLIASGLKFLAVNVESG